MNRRELLKSLGVALISPMLPSLMVSTRRSAFIKASHDFAYRIKSGSLQHVTNLSQKALWMQLYRAGLITHWELLDKLGIPDIGKSPL